MSRRVGTYSCLFDVRCDRAATRGSCALATLALGVVLALAGCGGSGGGGGAPTAGANAAVTMAWDRNSESDLAGYRVYRATSPGGYGAPIATLAPSVTSYSAESLKKGTTYYFALTAYDTAGNESPLSNQVTVTP